MENEMIESDIEFGQIKFILNGKSTNCVYRNLGIVGHWVVMGLSGTPIRQFNADCPTVIAPGIKCNTKSTDALRASDLSNQVA